jgi:hypothetical protein
MLFTKIYFLVRCTFSREIYKTNLRKYFRRNSGV